jgi:hypothetical protein
MAINARKNVDRTLLEPKQASVVRMIGQAKVLHQQGQLRKVTAPTSRVRSKPEPLRVQAVEA